MKGNTWTIVRKEFARFFGDKQLLFTTVIMPGLMIYIVYSLIGNGVGKMVSEGEEDVVVMKVENMPKSMAADLLQIDAATSVCPTGFEEEEIETLGNKDLNVVLLRFPEDFDYQIEYDGGEREGDVPNVEIYYNGANNASMRTVGAVQMYLKEYEEGRCNLFDVNREEENVSYNQADMDDVLGNIWSKLLPMLIMMMLFSGTMAIAPSSIAGEKERGTIATLLVTPMKRSELALGKIISLSCMALLSGVSSFVGIALSLPKMVRADAGELDLAFNYTFGDYAILLCVIGVTVLVMASVVSMLSAMAKDTKNAGTMVMPLMFVILLAGMLPMFSDGATENMVLYMVPFYNSIEVMVGLFAHAVSLRAVAITVGANVVYTALAVWGLKKMFDSEKIMFKR